MKKNAQTRRIFDNFDRLGYAFVIYEIYQLVQHGTSTTFESLPWRSRVVEHNCSAETNSRLDSNVVVLLFAFVEINSRFVYHGGSMMYELSLRCDL